MIIQKLPQSSNINIFFSNLLELGKINEMCFFSIKFCNAFLSMNFEKRRNSKIMSYQRESYPLSIPSYHITAENVFD